MNILRIPMFVLSLILPICASASDISKNSGSQTAEVLLEFISPAEKQRYYRLIDELRCPKCQNQNLADSDAPIAEDLRSQLYELISDNKTDQQIRDYMVARYGSFVLYEPPKNIHTASLWLLPLAVFIGGALVVLFVVRRGREPAVPSVDESAKGSSTVGEVEETIDSDATTELDALRRRLNQQEKN